MIPGFRDPSKRTGIDQDELANDNSSTAHSAKNESERSQPGHETCPKIISIKTEPIDSIDATLATLHDMNGSNFQTYSDTCTSYDHPELPNSLAELEELKKQTEELKKQTERQTQVINGLREELRLKTDVFEMQRGHWERLHKERQEEIDEKLKDIKKKQWCHECYELINANVPKQTCKVCNLFEKD